MNYRTLCLKPGHTVPEQMNFDFTDYEDLEKIIDGGLEFAEMNINGHYYDMIIDEDHKFKGKAPTLAIAHNSAITDIYGGYILFLKADEDGRTISLNQEDIDRIVSYFENNQHRAFIGTQALPVYDWFNV